MDDYRPDDDTEYTDLTACQAEVNDLRAMLRSRPAIEQAKGILMAQCRCTPDQAFRILSEAAQRDNRKVRDLAESIVASVCGDPIREDAS